MTHPTDDEIDALADKHIKYQLEGHKVSGVHDFARALLAEQARTEPVPLSDCGQLMEAIRGTAALLFGQGAAQQYPFATWRLLESYIDQMIAIVNAAARSAPPPPLKAEDAPSEELPRFNEAQERADFEAHLKAELKSHWIYNNPNGHDLVDMMVSVVPDEINGHKQTNAGRYVDKGIETQWHGWRARAARAAERKA